MSYMLDFIGHLAKSVNSLDKLYYGLESCSFVKEIYGVTSLEQKGREL